MEEIVGLILVSKTIEGKLAIFSAALAMPNLGGHW
jgi:hypothetical protein